MAIYIMPVSNIADNVLLDRRGNLEALLDDRSLRLLFRSFVPRNDTLARLALTHT